MYSKSTDGISSEDRLSYLYILIKIVIISEGKSFYAVK